MSRNNFVPIPTEIWPTPRTSSSRIKWIFYLNKRNKKLHNCQRTIKMKLRGQLISKRACNYYSNKKLNTWHGCKHINEYI